MQFVVAFIKETYVLYTKRKNDKHTNVDQNTYFNEHPFINVPAAELQQQELNDSERNADQDTDLNQHPSNNLTVALPSL